MRAFLAALILVAATAAATADDVLVTAEDGATFLLAPDGTWQDVIVGTGDDGQTYLLLLDGSWISREGGAAGLDGAFRQAAEAAVLRFNSNLAGAELDQVMACVMDAFAPLSDDDKQALIDVGMDPDDDMQDRFEQAYPGLEDDLDDCF